MSPPVTPAPVAVDNLGELPAAKHRNARLTKISREIISIERPEGVALANAELFTGRTGDRYGRPVALFHPELALLQQRLQTLDSQVKIDKDWIDPRIEGPQEPGRLDGPLLETAILFYDMFRISDSKISRVANMAFVFGRIFRRSPERQKYSSVSAGSKQGNICADAVVGDYVIYEDTNEPGFGGDRSLQAAVWYAKRCATTRNIYKDYKLPAILIGMMGNVLEVSIAVCLEEVLIDKILYLDVLDRYHRGTILTKLALIVSALRSCGTNLAQEYNDIKFAPRNLVRVGTETWHLPCPTFVFPSPNAPRKTLAFTAKLGRDNRPLTEVKENIDMRSLYLAKYDNVEVVVKFAVRYNQVAHHALAAQNYAPKLYACDEVLGKLHMVVMERLPFRRTKRMMEDDKTHCFPRSVFEDLEKALNVLHDAGLVYGDLRSTNVMIVTDDDNKMEAKLVDFDWAGPEGVAKYPILLNRELVESELAPDVNGFQVMYKKHDAYALSYLIKTYCEDEEYRRTKVSELRLNNGYAI